MNPNIVLIVADCLRRDRLGCYDCDKNISPTIDKVAAGGRKFDFAFSTGSWTVPAHGSLFTGSYSSENGIHKKNRYLSVDSEETLAGQLSEIGYKTVGFSTNPWVTPEFGFANGFDDFYEINSKVLFNNAGNPDSIVRDEDFDNNFQQGIEIIRWVLSSNPFKRIANGIHYKFADTHPIPKAETVFSRITEWYGDQEHHKPFFMFVNFMDVHEPYRIHKENMNLEDNDVADNPDINWNLGSLDQGTVSQSEDRWINSVYNASVQYLDSQLDRLLSWFNNRGDLEDTIFIITSDHGQSLGEHNYWGHGTFLYDELVDIPLVVSAKKEYLNLWPEELLTVSIGELPYFIMRSIGHSFENNSSVLNDTASKKLRGENAPVMAESHGPHTIGDYTSSDISINGYRTVYFNGWRLRRNLEEDSFEVGLKNPDQSEDMEVARHQLKELEAELLDELKTSGLEENRQSINSGTKQRLEDLGYV